MLFRSEGLVAESFYPEPRERYPMAEYGEDLIRSTISDISQIKKVAEIEPSKIYIYTSPSWKRDVYRMAAEILDSGEELTIPGLTKMAMADPEIRTNGKADSDLHRKVTEELKREDPSKIRRYADTDEFGIIKEAAEFLEEELGAPVSVYNADDKEKYDPKDRKSVV